MSSNPPKSNRSRLIFKLGWTVLFIAALGQTGMWVADWFVRTTPTSVVLSPEQTAAMSKPPARAMPPRDALMGPLGRYPAGAPVFSGEVVDAVTKQPLPFFFVCVGEEQAVGNAPSGGPLFAVNPPMVFGNGTYRTSTYGGGQVKYCLRVTAPGHRPALSGILAGGAVQDFALEPAANLSGLVVGPDGTPAGRAFVNIAVPGTPVYVDLAGPHGYITKSDGVYTFNPQSGLVEVAACAEQGFGRVTQDAGAADWTIHLQPWAHIQGQLTVAGKPAPNEVVRINCNEPYDPAKPAVNATGFAVTDTEGKFVLDYVPPGRVTIGRSFTQSIRQFRGSPMYMTQTVEVTAAPAQVLTVNIGGAGRPVVGRLVIDGGDMDITHYSVNQTIGGPHGYAMAIAPDGGFRIEDVVPGDYHVFVSLLPSREFPMVGQAERMTSFAMPPVPQGYSAEALDIGEIKLSR